MGSLEERKWVNQEYSFDYSLISSSRVNFEPQLLGREYLKVCRKNYNFHIYNSMKTAQKLLLLISANEDDAIELKVSQKLLNKT